MRRIFLACALLVSACTSYQFGNVIRPEGLVSSSAEKISFPVADAASVAAIEKWVNSGEKPSAAEISCNASGKSCKAVKQMLKKHKINTTEVALTGESSLALIYERVTAKNCEESHFGCATAANSLNMVTNRDQFIKPALSDYQDAAGAVRAVGKYSK
jgi:hypothetical protein